GMSASLVFSVKMSPSTRSNLPENSCPVSSVTTTVDCFRTVAASAGSTVWALVCADTSRHKHIQPIRNATPCGMLKRGRCARPLFNLKFEGDSAQQYHGCVPRVHK